MGGFEGAAAAAQEEGKRPGPWPWQGWPCGAAAGEGRPPSQPARGYSAPDSCVLKCSRVQVLLSAKSSADHCVR